MLELNRRAFFAVYREAFGPIKQDTVEGLDELLTLATDDPWPRLEDLASMLGQCKIETGNVFKPIVERGQAAYFDKYEPGTKLGKALGNTDKGDGYYFRGRGYTQNTGRRNYKLLSYVVGIDLIHNPDALLEPRVSHKAAQYAMTHGLYTGAKLETFTSLEPPNYYETRTVLNGHDRASEVKTNCIIFERALFRANYPRNG